MLKLEKKVSFFGCLLDSDERHDSVEEKLAAAGSSGTGCDPYRSIMEILRREVDPRLYEERGLIEVPEWLKPVPPLTERENIRVERFASFIDGEGCRKFASLVEDFVREELYPNVPCMIGIDHSLSGGAVRALSALYAPEKISLIVLDSHTDAVPVSVLSGAVAYDMETNPASVHDPDDPLLTDRRESYNACSFLHYVLQEGAVDPQNLYLIGIGDYPPKRAFRVKDQRIKRYVEAYSGLKKRGVKIISKKELLTKPSKIAIALQDVRTPCVYISLDMDVGARNAMEEVRFKDRQGINEQQLYGVADRLAELLGRGTKLVGMDLTEFNPRQADPSQPPENVPAYRIAANLIKKLLFGKEASN